MASELYIIRIIESVDLVDLWSGMLKSLVFAWLIIGIACETGLSVRGGAEGVGMATTQSVVKAIIAMLIANALLTAGFFVFDR
jgi:phospholipid/cholesterol/gamma-HCH transport system permease protein